MDLIDYSSAIAEMEKHLFLLIKGFLGLAYHEYQKQKHLLGDLSFHDWVDKLSDEFHESGDCPKD